MSLICSDLRLLCLAENHPLSIQKRNYNFVFYLYENGEPLPGVRALLTQKRDVVRIDGKLVHTVSDAYGKIEFKQIPGGVYRVETENGLSVKGKFGD